MSSWYIGNAADESDDHRGWLVGHFMPDGEIRQSNDVEIKWGQHPVGEQRDSWQGDETRTTVLLLVNGRFRIDLSVTNHLLSRPGDYVMWGPGVGHSWQAEADSVVLTIRWPSRP